MFTVKHFKANGQLFVTGCVAYERKQESPNFIELQLAPGSTGPRDIDLAPGDRVFIENVTGKTVDLIRA